MCVCVFVCTSVCTLYIRSSGPGKATYTHAGECLAGNVMSVLGNGKNAHTSKPFALSLPHFLTWKHWKWSNNTGSSVAVQLVGTYYIVCMYMYVWDIS